MDYEMSDTYLILDCPFLCYRAMYGMKQDLTYSGSVTSVVYTFLREIVALQQQFHTNKLLFCFDSKSSLRKKIYPQYKAKRHKRDEDFTPEEIEVAKAFRFQVKKLRTEYLPEIGYKNIYREKGFESDDLIADLCSGFCVKMDGDKAVIISADHDLYQCINKSVSFYNPNNKKELTVKSFRKEFGIVPIQWTLVKAIAGCNTDEIEGIKGVGEKTAIKYVKGELKPHLKTFQAIESNEGRSIIDRNWRLVHLPFEGTPILEIKKDDLSIAGWKSVCSKLGFSSLTEKFNPFPYSERKR